jgi:hypothetical protein
LSPSAGRPRPTLLFWNDCWGEVPNTTAEGTEVVTDRAVVADADAVVFHIPTLKWKKLPKKRPGQLWVAWSWESPANYPVMEDKRAMAAFDLTATYERKSDVWTPYFGPGSLLGPDRAPALPLPGAGSRAPVVFLQSNKEDRCGRVAYTADVMKTAQVDSFGSVHRNRKKKIPHHKARWKLYAKYKFVLAFENSIATDYVTEKFFEPIAGGAVPVYRGAPEVAELAPAEDCYIDAATFSSGRELGRYLDHLDGHDEEYLAYQRWRERGPSPSFLAHLEVLRRDWVDRLADAVVARQGCAKTAAR